MKIDPKVQENIIEVSGLFDGIAGQYHIWKRKSCYYRQELERFYLDIIPKGKNVLEIGSGDGALLAKLCPGYGVGLDISRNMIDMAKNSYPSLNFINSPIENYSPEKRLDYVVTSNLFEYVYDLYDFFNNLRPKVSLNTKIVITGVNPLWEPVLKLTTKLRLRTPVQMKNFITYRDIENVLNVSGYEVIESGYRVFFPKKIPFISYFLNKLIPRLPVFKNLCLVQYIIARPKQELRVDAGLACSVIIPCHNEEGNIKNCIERIPEMGSRTEIVVVDDGSTDKTADITRIMSEKRQGVKLISYMPNKGKGCAVKTGFDAASGDILIILDADMAVTPEELVKFYNVLASHQAEFVNGTRMLYDMAPGAMKFLNFLGNKAFGIILSFIIGQRNTDTLCGTKAFFKNDYKNFRMGKCPWGDFDLLFESARMKLKMVEMPIHYNTRVEGVSKMKAFRHGIQLLKMCWHGFWYLG